MRGSLLALAVAAVAATIAFPGGTRAQRLATPSPSPSPSLRPVPPARDVVTHHVLAVGGTRIAYAAHAGTLLLHDGEDRPTASVFSVAYLAGAHGSRPRPVTFLWNGGPGGSSAFLHLAAFGPLRVRLPAAGAQPSPDASLVANRSSLLDVSDLVFVDAVGTGWSTLAGRGRAADFYGVDEDAAAFAQFVERWLSAFGRWRSPTFLLGESYGAMRAALVARKLEEDGVAVSGVVLQSPALDYAFLPGGGRAGEDYRAIAFLPSEAAVAWYHRAAPGNAPDLARFVAEARAFAEGPYASALLRGDRLDPATRTRIVAQLHAYTGLDERYLEEANLRVDPQRFMQQLLRGAQRSVGRYDGRSTGPDLDANDDVADFDPSAEGVRRLITRAFNDYARRELRYRAERPYDVLDPAVNRAWKFRRGREQNAPSVVNDLKAALTRDPGLRVFAASGYYDLATPFYGTAYLLGHMHLAPELQGHVRIATYRAGHMISLDDAALAAYKRDLAAFYRDALAADHGDLVPRAAKSAPP